ncbi:MAG: hypothetical protein HC886_23090 [Leptolyngbyaceae cyanobacterium SM1_1_3]|nr:hypothetical protein [Leptolyngbyaceae cyanobacterium SM1_1_3]NJN02130.1 hypothetical protein [Leptolyngbyaceae cyanobacterium RM1_1_2]NJO08985.1 hypothetical protein [Leptolyngbyaceae cyanobacterium SL_1_1]
MTHPNAWTPQRLANLSQDLATVFYPGCDRPQSPQRSQGWTLEKLRALGEILA